MNFEALKVIYYVEIQMLKDQLVDSFDTLKLTIIRAH